MPVCRLYCVENLARDDKLAGRVPATKTAPAGFRTLRIEFCQGIARSKEKTSLKGCISHELGCHGCNDVRRVDGNEMFSS
jgi:hypothetical protein